MAELVTIAAAREHHRLKTIAYTARKYHKSPEAAREAFFRMANIDEQSETVDRVDSLPPAHVRPISPSQLPDNFAQPPIPVVPEAHPIGGDGAAASTSMSHSRPSVSHGQTSKQKPLLPRYLSEHSKKAIDEKWAAKKARKDARYHKHCDKLDRKYGGPGEAKHANRRQKLDDKHRKKTKSLELDHSIEISMAEWRARKKAEKKQKKERKKAPDAEDAVLVQVPAGTDGAGEPLNKQRKRTSRSSQRCRTNTRSSSDAIFSFNGSDWQPTNMRAAGINARRSVNSMIMGGGVASVATMAPVCGGCGSACGC